MYEQAFVTIFILQHVKVRAPRPPLYNVKFELPYGVANIHEVQRRSNSRERGTKTQRERGTKTQRERGTKTHGSEVLKVKTHSRERDTKMQKVTLRDDYSAGRSDPTPVTENRVKNVDPRNKLQRVVFCYCASFCNKCSVVFSLYALP